MIIILQFMTKMIIILQFMTKMIIILQLKQISTKDYLTVSGRPSKLTEISNYLYKSNLS